MDVLLPAKLFAKHVEAEQKAGNKIVSDKRKKNGSRVISFQDGGKIMRHKSGHIIHKYADGKKTQCSPDGKRITVDADGTQTQTDPNGNKVVKNTNGSSTKVLATGQVIHVYEDGSRKQINADGSAIIREVDGTESTIPPAQQPETPRKVLEPAFAASANADVAETQTEFNATSNGAMLAGSGSATPSSPTGQISHQHPGASQQTDLEGSAAVKFSVDGTIASTQKPARPKSTPMPVPNFAISTDANVYQTRNYASPRGNNVASPSVGLHQHSGASQQSSVSAATPNTTTPPVSASAVPTIFFKHIRPDQLFTQHLNAAVNADNAIVSDKTSRSSGTRKGAQRKSSPHKAPSDPTMESYRSQSVRQRKSHQSQRGHQTPREKRKCHQTPREKRKRHQTPREKRKLTDGAEAFAPLKKRTRTTVTPSPPPHTHSLPVSDISRDKSLAELQHSFDDLIRAVRNDADFKDRFRGFSACFVALMRQKLPFDDELDHEDIMNAQACLSEAKEAADAAEEKWTQDKRRLFSSVFFCKKTSRKRKDYEGLEGCKVCREPGSEGEESQLLSTENEIFHTPTFDGGKVPRSKTFYHRVGDMYLSTQEFDLLETDTFTRVCGLLGAKEVYTGHQTVKSSTISAMAELHVLNTGAAGDGTKATQESHTWKRLDGWDPEYLPYLVLKPEEIEIVLVTKLNAESPRCAMFYQMQKVYDTKFYRNLSDLVRSRSARDQNRKTFLIETSRLSTRGGGGAISLFGCSVVGASASVNRTKSSLKEFTITFHPKYRLRSNTEFKKFRASWHAPPNYRVKHVS